MKEETIFDPCYLAQIISGCKVRYFRWLPEAMKRSAMMKVGNYYGACSAVGGYLIAPDIFLNEWDATAFHLTACYVHPERIVTTVSNLSYGVEEVGMNFYIPEHRSCTDEFELGQTPQAHTVLYLANPLYGFIPVWVKESTPDQFPDPNDMTMVLPREVRTGVIGSYLYNHEGLAVGLAASSPNSDGEFAVQPMINILRMYKGLQKHLESEEVESGN